MKESEKRVIMRRSLWEKYGGRCAYCGGEISEDGMLVDLIFGYCGYEDDLLEYKNPICRACHKIKRDETVVWFRKHLVALRRAITSRKRVWKKHLDIWGFPVDIYGWDGLFHYERGGNV
jgi:hypothetical protein